MLPMRFRVPVFGFGLLVGLVPCLSAQQTVVPLWPHGTPEPAQTTAAETDVTKPTDALISGRRTARITNVANPTMSVYLPPSGKNTGAAALVFPGGGYIRLAWNGEGTDTCAWLNSVGMACLLVKYRVPEKGRYPDNPADFEDAQQAMRLARAHAKEWRIDPLRIGVMGFSAGGHLAVALSTHWDDTHVETTPAAADVDAHINARPDFAVLGYPAYLDLPPDHVVVDPAVAPQAHTPPTFIIQAENDRVAINSSLAYYRALKDAHVPAQMHLYASGGHGFGMHPVGTPEEHWTQLAADWLRAMGILPNGPAGNSSLGVSGASGTSPCPMPQPVAGRPSDTPRQPSNDPACWYGR